MVKRTRRQVITGITATLTGATICSTAVTATTSSENTSTETNTTDQDKDKEKDKDKNSSDNTPSSKSNEPEETDETPTEDPEPVATYTMDELAQGDLNARRVNYAYFMDEDDVEGMGFAPFAALACVGSLAGTYILR